MQIIKKANRYLRQLLANHRMLVHLQRLFVIQKLVLLRFYRYKACQSISSNHYLWKAGFLSLLTLRSRPQTPLPRFHTRNRFFWWGSSSWTPKTIWNRTDRSLTRFSMRTAWTNRSSHCVSFRSKCTWTRFFVRTRLWFSWSLCFCPWFWRVPQQHLPK